MFVRCPECNKEILMRYREADRVETHGLDCGPFERFHDEWYECPACGAVFTTAESLEILQ